MDRHGSGLFLSINEVEHQRLDVAVKDQTDDLGVLIDDGAARVAADDVGGADEIERRLQIELALTLDPALRQVERLLVMVLRGPLVQTGDGGLEGDLLAVFLEAL